MKNTLLLFTLFFTLQNVYAENIKTLVLYYQEKEEGVDAQNMRYLINKDFLRIDNGDERADFILFDTKNNIIYSVNHEDQTILKITNKKWSSPKFNFETSTKIDVLHAAPKINNHQVHRYQFVADNQVCTTVYLIKENYSREMEIQQQYQQVLSGQQVATLNNTPVEFHTPCFLTDQVYHSGEYYELGLPVQITFSRGYSKYLKSYKYEDIKRELFSLPDGYNEYSSFKD